MPLKPLKKDATQEEINEWIIDSSEEFVKVETELANKTKREKELEEHNQKLFLRVTSKVDATDKTKEEDEDVEIMKKHIGEDVYKNLNKKDIENLKIIMNGEDE